MNFSELSQEEIAYIAIDGTNKNKQKSAIAALKPESELAQETYRTILEDKDAPLHLKKQAAKYLISSHAKNIELITEMILLEKDYIFRNNLLSSISGKTEIGACALGFVALNCDNELLASKAIENIESSTEIGTIVLKDTFKKLDNIDLQEEIISALDTNQKMANDFAIEVAKNPTIEKDVRLRAIQQITPISQQAQNALVDLAYDEDDDIRTTTIEYIQEYDDEGDNSPPITTTLPKMRNAEYTNE